MKISKLFHWLYAILMLLPFLVFLPNAFYYGFNDHAVAQTRIEQEPVYYETNNVNDSNDIITGRAYLFSYVNTNIYSSSQYEVDEILLLQYTNRQYRNDNQYTQPPYFFPYSEGNVSVCIINQNNGQGNYNYSQVNVYFVAKTGIDYSGIVSYISKSNINFIKEYQPVEYTMSITDSMSYAWESVWQNDLFSWSYGSFLTEPFIYIGNVFNVPVDNTLYYALSYWLDISIIWLCFDVIMYVPLLVHRWLDKGIVE